MKGRLASATKVSEEQQEGLSEYARYIKAQLQVANDEAAAIAKKHSVDMPEAINALSEDSDEPSRAASETVLRTFPTVSDPEIDKLPEPTASKVTVVIGKHFVKVSIVIS